MSPFVWLLVLNAITGTDVSTQGRMTQQPHPVIIIPGEAGSRMYIRPNSEPQQRPNLVWLNLSVLADVENVTRKIVLTYDPVTQDFQSNHHYDVTFPGWGDTKTIEYLNPDRSILSRYLYDMVESIKMDPYYVSNCTIRGAPYDFRKAPSRNAELVSELKDLVEETYIMNHYRKVVIVAHSMGTLVGLNFLRKQTDRWKGRYIKSFVFVSGPFGGTVKALRAVTSGDNFGVPTNPVNFRPLERGMPSVASMIPNPRLWTREEPIIVTPEVNYSAHDYNTLFCNIRASQVYLMYLDSTENFNTFKRPTGIEQVVCVHGSGVDTEEVLHYKPVNLTHPGFPDEQPQIEMGDGDGTVNMRSLNICRQWKNIVYADFPGATHTGVTHDSRFLSLLRKIIGSNVSSEMTTL